LIHQRYGYEKVSIFGEDYPVPANKAMLGKLLQYGQYGFLAVIMFGDSIFSYMGTAYPSWYLTVRESKMMYGIGAWLVGNMAI
jgi:hypothetical protein